MSNSFADVLIAELKRKSPSTLFKYNKVGGYYYVSETGRQYTMAQVSKIAGDYNKYAAQALDRLVERFLDGNLSLQRFQVLYRQGLKDAYVVNLQLARGGARNVTFSDYGRLGNMLKQEYRYFDNFVREIAQGRFSRKYIIARMRMYGRGVGRAWELGKFFTAVETGKAEMRRITKSVERCDDCLGYEAMGWQPIGSLPMPGVGSVCQTNCQCETEYR